MRKRAPMPQQSISGPDPLLGNPTSTSTTSTGPDPQSTTTTSTSLLPSTTSTTDPRLATSSTSSLPSVSISQNSASSKSSLSSSRSLPPQNTLTTGDADGVSTVILPGGTSTSSVVASPSFIPDQQSNTSSTQAKSTTLTVLIAIAASVGGIFIFWTIFRKWKLSSSKEFDRRLNPIDWQPTTGEDDQLPGHARRHSVGSLHSSGHGHGATGLSRVPSNVSNPFDDFDRPAQPSPVQVGGYADLARGSSPTHMQERNHYGPTYNHDVTPVPLHHQGGF